MGIIKSPVTQKRIARFKEQKLAYYSFLLILVLYLLSLFAEIFCNSSPLYVRHNGRSYFPVFKFYAEDSFLLNGKKTRPNYKKINTMPEFKDNDSSYMIFPPFKYGPLESVDPGLLLTGNNVDVKFSPVERVGRVNIRNDFTVAGSASFSSFAGVPEKALRGNKLLDYIDFSEILRAAILIRFNNESSEKYSELIIDSSGNKIQVSLSTYSKRKRPPKTVRIMFREVQQPSLKSGRIVFNQDLKPVGALPEIWSSISEDERAALLKIVEERYKKPVDPFKFIVGKREYKALFIKHDVRFPYKPVEGHLLGIDGAGRDVFARIFYGLRISLTFGLLLVGFSMTIGVAAGAVQGYYGGKTDLGAQRFIEIWSALPFLYIMILMGSIYGRSFGLLLFCYGIFNWIGISYYVRAEFLKLRKQPFVESAKCMGVSSRKIIFRHIMPNAMTPVITFFPFSLVGAIGSLAALDYLGFGLPPPTPSWGELFFQAQQYRWAWWLIVYPAAALFIVMIAGVFVGDGIRNAFDPKRYTRLE